MPEIESAFIDNKKHEDICGKGVPELNSVGVACVKYFKLIRLYVSMAESMSSLCIPRETLMSICCGLSTIFLSTK